jgi:hypothetical protein
MPVAAMLAILMAAKAIAITVGTVEPLHEAHPADWLMIATIVALALLMCCLAYHGWLPEVL